MWVARLRSLWAGSLDIVDHGKKANGPYQLRLRFSRDRNKSVGCVRNCWDHPEPIVHLITVLVAHGELKGLSNEEALKKFPTKQSIEDAASKAKAECMRSGSTNGCVICQSCTRVLPSVTTTTSTNTLITPPTSPDFVSKPTPMLGPGRVDLPSPNDNAGTQRKASSLNLNLESDSEDETSPVTIEYSESPIPSSGKPANKPPTLSLTPERPVRNQDGHIVSLLRQDTGTKMDVFGYDTIDGETFVFQTEGKNQDRYNLYKFPIPGSESSKEISVYAPTYDSARHTFLTHVEKEDSYTFYVCKKRKFCCKCEDEFCEMGPKMLKETQAPTSVTTARIVTLHRNILSEASKRRLKLV